MKGRNKERERESVCMCFDNLLREKEKRKLQLVKPGAQLSIVTGWKQKSQPTFGIMLKGQAISLCNQENRL